MARRKTWTVLCLRCHEEAEARWVDPSADWIELLVYVLSIPLLCIPGLMLAIYREAHSHWACDVCGSKEIVPVASKRAKEIGRGGVGNSSP